MDKWSLLSNQLKRIRVKNRSSHSELFLRKGVLKNMQQIYRRHPCRSAILIKLQSFLEIALRHGCSPVNLLHIFWTSFTKNTSSQLLLNLVRNFDLAVLQMEVKLYCMCEERYFCKSSCYRKRTITGLYVELNLNILNGC